LTGTSVDHVTFIELPVDRAALRKPIPSKLNYITVFKYITYIALTIFEVLFVRLKQMPYFRECQEKTYPK
jgi:hypothetical protein